MNVGDKLLLNNKIKLIKSSVCIFGNIDDEKCFNNNIISLLSLCDTLPKNCHDIIFFEISNLYKQFIKRYNIYSLKYSQKALQIKNGYINTQSKYVVYIENVMFVYTYDESLNVLTLLLNSNISKNLNLIIKFYIGLLNYINDIDDYINYLIDFKNNNANLNFYQSIPLDTFCTNISNIDLTFDTIEPYNIENIIIADNYKMCIVTSVDINYFIKYAKFLCYSFLKNNKNYLLIIDLIINNSDENHNYDLINKINSTYDQIKIIIKKIKYQNIKAYSSTLRLVRANNIININNKPCLVIDFDSVFNDNIDDLYTTMNNYDTCTRELQKVYPWQKYTCGFIFFNITPASKQLLLYINCFLNKTITFESECLWIDQNALEAGFRKIQIMNININKKNLFYVKDRFIVSPTGSHESKNSYLQDNSKYIENEYKYIDNL
jgi:hypothetical protein